MADVEGERPAPEAAGDVPLPPAETLAQVVAFAESKQRAPSLQHETRARLELLVLVVVVVAVGFLGAAVNRPVTDAGCDGVVPFELALPPTVAPMPPDGAVAPEGSVTPGGRATEVRGLRTIDGVLHDCDEAFETDAAARAEIADGLRRSTYLDFPFLVLYGAGLVWCCARAAGLRPWGLAPVQSSLAVSTVARTAMWFALAAAICDAIENGLLLVTADDLADPEHSVVRLTAAAAGAKFLLLLLPLAVTAWMLGRLALASVRATRRTGMTGTTGRLRLAYERVGGAGLEPATSTAGPPGPMSATTEAIQ